MTGREPPSDLPDDLKALERFSTVMDRAFRIPGLGIEVGLDALVGLVPGIGDVVTTIMAYGTIIAGVRHRVPSHVLARMIVNTLIDMGVGTVPVVGDILDVFYKSNVKNVELLVEHRDVTQPPRDVPAIVKLAVGAVAALLLAVVLVVAWTIYGIIKLAGG